MQNKMTIQTLKIAKDIIGISLLADTCTDSSGIARRHHAVRAQVAVQAQVHAITIGTYQEQGVLQMMQCSSLSTFARAA
jgi:hypothetical protein